MNRFDRVTSLLLLLQTRTVVTARFLSDHFDVSERTIYRDIRTLENAGVPIGSEAGVGYWLDKGYRLPPVSFTLDEAAALLLGEKLLVSSLDVDSLKDFKQALNKIRAVIDSSDKDYLSSLDVDIEVLPTGSHFPLDAVNRHDQNRVPLELMIRVVGQKLLVQLIAVTAGCVNAAAHWCAPKWLKSGMRPLAATSKRSDRSNRLGCFTTAGTGT